MRTNQAVYDAVVPHAKGSVIGLTVSPRASVNRIEMDSAGLVRVRLTAPPVEGAANTALLKFLAAVLGVPRSSLSIVAGAQSRQKRVLVDGMSDESVRRALAQASGSRFQ